MSVQQTKHDALCINIHNTTWALTHGMQKRFLSSSLLIVFTLYVRILAYVTK